MLEIADRDHFLKSPSETERKLAQISTMNTGKRSLAFTPTTQRCRDGQAYAAA
jgi:hypothetical protein